LTNLRCDRNILLDDLRSRAISVAAFVATMIPNHTSGKRNLLLAVATDIHFWIPLGVLLGGLLLLDRLR
jgi:hypothetical protein